MIRLYPSTMFLLLMLIRLLLFKLLIVITFTSEIAIISSEALVPGKINYFLLLLFSSIFLEIMFRERMSSHRFFNFLPCFSFYSNTYSSYLFKIMCVCVCVCFCVYVCVCIYELFFVIFCLSKYQSRFSAWNQLPSTLCFQMFGILGL